MIWSRQLMTTLYSKALKGNVFDYVRKFHLSVK